jgi:hypothetical protein
MSRIKRWLTREVERFGLAGVGVVYVVAGYFAVHMIEGASGILPYWAKDVAIAALIIGLPILLVLVYMWLKPSVKRSQAAGAVQAAGRASVKPAEGEGIRLATPELDKLLAWIVELGFGVSIYVLIWLYMILWSTFGRAAAALALVSTVLLVIARWRDRVSN